MFSKEYFIKWAKAAGIRALKTVAETAVATIGTSAVISQVDWRLVISASLLAGIVSLLLSIRGLPETDYELELESAYESLNEVEGEQWQ